MKFRLKAFGLHIVGSACILALVLGALYLGWYRWPGWYLTGALRIAAMMAAFDVVLGPLLTFVIANPNKPRRELARDIGIIVCVQIIALGYGATTLWNGRVLYYAFSTKWLEIVQASDLSAAEIERAVTENPAFAPHWYSTPRWVYAPLPEDESTRQKIIAGTLTGSDDVIQMPRYFKPWAAGLPELRKQLRVVGTLTEFSLRQKQVLKERMRDLDVPEDAPVTVPMMGKGQPLLAVLDPATLRIRKLLKPQ